MTPFRLLTLLALAAAPPTALAQDPEVPRPKTSFLRQDEDWSLLRGVDLDATDDPLDRIKFVPLSEDGSVWASFGGQLRGRMESWNGFGFGLPLAADSNDSFYLWLARLHADVHFGERFRVFAEVKSALADDRTLAGGTRPVDEDELALQQLFADAVFDVDDGTTLTVRPGRQMLLFGKQRLVSPLPWANALRAWDGVSTIYRDGPLTTTFFYTDFVPVDRRTFNERDGDHPFYGLYASRALDGGPATSVDLYWLHRERRNVTWNGTTGTDERDTFGLRLAGAPPGGPFDWEVEGALQTGEVGTMDVSGAWMVAAVAGYRLPDLPGAPRLWTGFDYATGDDAPGGSVGTFDQLFPLGHAYLGIADVVGRQNVVDACLGASLTPCPDVTLQVAGHALRKAQGADGVYGVGGGLALAPGAAASREIGQELDVVTRWRFHRHWSLELGYSHVFAGDVPTAAGAPEDIDFAYLSLETLF